MATYLDFDDVVTSTAAKIAVTRLTQRLTLEQVRSVVLINGVVLSELPNDVNRALMDLQSHRSLANDAVKSCVLIR